jgi:threonine/homoserine/homoserine lactone efflux protein
LSTEFLLTTLVVVASRNGRLVHPRGRPRARRARQHPRRGRVHARHRPAHVGGDHRLAALLHTSALAFQALKYLGVAYLLFMAWSALRDKGALTVESTAQLSPVKVIVSGVLINLLNPKLTIFYGVFAAAVREHVISRPRVVTWMRRVFGGAFVALAGRLAFTER